jgi:hypothetical protein
MEKSHTFMLKADHTPVLQASLFFVGQLLNQHVRHHCVYLGYGHFLLAWDICTLDLDSTIVRFSIEATSWYR